LTHDKPQWQETKDANWELEVFYDGDCPLCRREISALRRMDRQRRIRFTDIAAPGFSAEDLGKSRADLMDCIHARLPDGRWVTGVEVFRRLYSAVGFSRVVALTRLPVLSGLLDWGYSVFARNRLKWTGRCPAGSGSCHL
jgi:predicted DCC family thiol-disulfide oxidoreductase YuxK